MASFSAADLTVISNGGTKAKGPSEGMSFGLAFTDHMLVIEHAVGTGWGAPVIKPFQNLSLHPSAQVLHYGMSCFEGMKAYKGVDGAPRLFRPRMNMKRFHRSCQRLMLPAFDTEEMLKCIEALVKLDKDWLPEGEGSALYIRPFGMNTSAFLNLRPPNHATIVVTLSPSAQFFSTESKGEKLFLNETHVRAWPGGAGEHKLASNYGPTLQPHLEAGKEHGCIMVMFCLPQGPSPEDALISECAGMNVFFFLEKEDGRKELCTPPLDGTILPGVTRDSVIELCRSWNEFEVSERNITVSELTTAAHAGRLLEVLGAGTAVTILPVVEIKREKGPDCKCRCECFADMPLTNRLRKTLFDIQLGHVEHEWSIKL